MNMHINFVDFIIKTSIGEKYMICLLIVVETIVGCHQLTILLTSVLYAP